MKWLTFALVLSLLTNILLVKLGVALVDMVKEAEADAKAAWAEIDAHNDRP